MKIESPDGTPVEPREIVLKPSGKTSKVKGITVGFILVLITIGIVALFT